MTIFVGSRYEFDPVYSIECPDSSLRNPVLKTHSHLTIYANTDNANRGDPTYPYRVHIVVDGDRLDELSNRFYGVPGHWWYIADANPDQIYDPLNLVPGTLLRIPNAPS